MGKRRKKRIKKNENESESIEIETNEISKSDLENDPQATVIQNAEVSKTVDICNIIKADNETNDISYGIDVSKYQGNIDWRAVASSKIDFALIRIGYRTQVDGSIIEDECAKYNLQEATKYGIKVGEYFFSTAITEQETQQEADFVTNLIKGYSITYPVAFNCEGFRESSNRQYGMSISERTQVALAFLDRVQQAGYKGMFYASKSEMDDENLWDMNKIASNYKVWVSQYKKEGYPQNSKSDYSGTTAVWQYTNSGKVSGIKTIVDLNIAYFSYTGESTKAKETNHETVTKNMDVGANFSNVSETVTPKDSVNLRSSMEQGDDSNVVVKMKNGETATRIGVSANGWSKLNYNGQTLYAVSSYLQPIDGE